MKINISLLVMAVLCFVFASCATPEQTAAAVAAVGTTATALINSLGPLLPPETLAKLQANAANIDGTVQATATAVGTIADAIAQLKASAGSQITQVVEANQALALKLAAAPTQEQLLAYNAGTGLLAVGGSRVMSHYKHTKKGA